jgi:hypothetical protein
MHDFIFDYVSLSLDDLVTLVDWVTRPVQPPRASMVERSIAAARWTRDSGVALDLLPCRGHGQFLTDLRDSII